MKKSKYIIGSLLLGLSLSSYAIINWSQLNPSNSSSTCKPSIDYNHQFIKSIYRENPYPDFFYQLGPRFAGFKKSKLSEAKSIQDFFEREDIQKIHKIHRTQVILVIDDKQSEKREAGDSEQLNPNQIAMLQSMEYSDNFLIRADFEEEDIRSGEIKNNYASPHWTVVPEKQAFYSLGKEALLEFLEKNNKEYTKNMSKDKLQPAKLYFTIDEKGEIRNIKLDRSSGNEEIDNNMLKLMEELPGEWIPAEDLKGKHVNQELVISFGIPGC